MFQTKLSNNMGHSNSYSSGYELTEETARNDKAQRVFEEIVAYFQVLLEFDYPEILKFGTETLKSVESEVDNDFISGEPRQQFFAINGIYEELLGFEGNNIIEVLRNHIGKEHVRFFAKCVFCSEEFDDEFSHISVLSHAQDFHMEKLEELQEGTLMNLGQNDDEKMEKEILRIRKMDI